MATTQADLDNLIAARNAAELSVRSADGSQVQYRSMDELERAIKAAQRELSAASSSTKRVRQIRFYSSKGL